MANIPPQYDYIKNINNCYVDGGETYGGVQDFYSFTEYYANGGWRTPVTDMKQLTIIAPDCSGSHTTENTTNFYLAGFVANDTQAEEKTPVTINVTGDENGATVSYDTYHGWGLSWVLGSGVGNARQFSVRNDNSYFPYLQTTNNSWTLYTQTNFNNLSSALQYIYMHYVNIKLYVNGEDWTSPYNWQSVPSISGKNGILSLVTLDSESINDGEPVSGAAVSVFDQNPVSGNNVKDIADGNTPLIPSAVDVTAAFIISNPPVGELASRILAAKKGSIPESIEDADKTVSIPADASNVTMPGLDENSQYYFAIFVADAVGDTAVSDPKDIYTSADEGWIFDHTGEIQTFTAPKTGIYQLETWGAQGGDATDGTNTARGGYGAYAVGEVLLNQGDTLYINVGGQNGYGGGGGYVPPSIEIPTSVVSSYYASPTVDNNINFASDELKNSSGTVQYVNTDTCILIGDQNKNRLVNENSQIKYTNSNGSSISAEYIPIGSMQTIKNVSFTYKKTDNNSYNYFDLYLVKVASDGTIEDKVMILQDRGTSAYNVWTDISYDCDFEANYIVTVGLLGTWYMKDIVLTL